MLIPKNHAKGTWEKGIARGGGFADQSMVSMGREPENKSVPGFKWRSIWGGREAMLGKTQQRIFLREKNDPHHIIKGEGRNISTGRTTCPRLRGDTEGSTKGKREKTTQRKEGKAVGMVGSFGREGRPSPPPPNQTG